MADPTTHSEPSRAITLRSSLLGLLGVIAICAITPFNDYALNNTFVIGNFLPVGLVLVVLTLVLLVNVPLLCFAPNRALTTAELAVATSMMLVACAIPSSGFMRYVPTSIVGIHVAAGDQPRFAAALRSADLPDWVLPDFQSTDPADRANERVVRDYYALNTEQSGIAAVPWGAWVRPAIAWGAFATALFGACLCLSMIVHHQWTKNERLAYPLAGVYLSLIESPGPGRWLNATLRSPLFWIAAGAVFFVHSFNGLGVYFPKYLPKIPLGFNFEQMVSDTPLRHVDWYLKRAPIYFTVVGICFFVQSKVSFSLWATLVLLNVVRAVLRSQGSDITDGQIADQNMGTMLAFGAMILWVGRHHWAMVARHMIGARRGKDPAPEFAAFGSAGWGLVLCVAGLVTWVWCAGASLVLAGWIVGFILLTYLLIARVVAETGIMFVQIRGYIARPLQQIAMLAPLGSEASYRAAAPGAFLSFWFNQMLVHDARESAMGFQTQALRLGEEATQRSSGRAGRWEGRWFIASLALAMVVGFVVAGASTLLTEYNFGSTQELNPVTPINDYAMVMSTRPVLDWFDQYASGAAITESHNATAHLAGGAALTGILGALRLRFAWWPFHPVGLLVMYTYPMWKIWFSILIGWMTKVVVVRLGGPGSFRSARPIFLGLIVGESAAAGFWLIVTLLMFLTGQPYFAVRLTPE